MAPVEWFRTGDWDESARETFETRLARARADNRAQYLRIKALSLHAAGSVAAATDLLHRVLEEFPDSLDAAACAELLGDMACEAGAHQEAEHHYRRSLDLSAAQNGTSGEVHVGLAEALLGQGRHREALDALRSSSVSELTMNRSICRWNAALAQAAHGAGEREAAMQAAQAALALLDAPDQFSRHPGVGRGSLNDETVKRLRAISKGGSTRGTWRRRWPRRDG